MVFMTSHKVRLPYVSDEADALLMWRDPKASGIVLGAATAAYILLGFFSPLLLVLRGLALLVAVSLIWTIAASMLGRPGPPVPPIFTTGFSEDQWRSMTSTALPHVNQALGTTGTLLSGTKPALSAQVGGALLAASYILARISLLGLLYTAVVVAFSVPKLYEVRKDDADKLLSTASAKAKQLYGKVDEALLKKIPKAAAKKLQ